MVIAEPVCAIFNASLHQDVFPTLWKLSTSDQSPSRQTLSKIFESDVGQCVLEAVSSKIDNRQFGGLKGKSITHELVDLLHHWYEALDKSQHIRVFVDYSKASV